MPIARSLRTSGFSPATMWPLCTPAIDVVWWTGNGWSAPMAFWIRTKKKGLLHQTTCLRSRGAGSRMMLDADLNRCCFWICSCSNVAQLCSKMYQDVVSKSRTPNVASTWRHRARAGLSTSAGRSTLDWVPGHKKHNTCATGDWHWWLTPVTIQDIPRSSEFFGSQSSQQMPRCAKEHHCGWHSWHVGRPSCVPGATDHPWSAWRWGNPPGDQISAINHGKQWVNSTINQ